MMEAKVLQMPVKDDDVLVLHEAMRVLGIKVEYKLSPESRKKLSEHLYTKYGWQQQRIANALGVSQGLISGDLAGLLETNKPPPRPKGGRPKGSKPRSRPVESKAPSTPATDIAYETIVAWLGEGKKITNQRKWGDEREDIASHASFEKAFDRLNREKAKAVTAKANEDTALEKAEAAFSDKSKITLADAIRIHKARLDRQFEQTVNAEVRKRIAAADDSVRSQLKEANQRILQFERERGKRGVFTKEQFRQLQICCHPDASASKETRAVLLDILVKNKTNLVNPEKE